MRQILRSKAAGGLFLLLIIAMSAWGGTSFFTENPDGNLVTAGNRVLSSRQFDATLERFLFDTADDRGRILTREQAIDQGFVDQLFEREQSRLALIAHADMNAAGASDQAIDDAIRNMSIFQDATGLYDPGLYVSVLRENGIRPDDYRRDIEAEITVWRLQDMLVAGLQAPDSLARSQAAHAHERRQASYFPLKQGTLDPVGIPNEDQLREMYEANQQILVEPERRAISVIFLGPEDYMPDDDISGDDIAAFYDIYKAERFARPDSRRFTEFVFSSEASARMSLGPIAGGGDSRSVPDALSVTENTGKKASITNERLASQVFSPTTRPGSIHGPQQDGDRYIVIRLEDIIPGESEPLEAVRGEIIRELAREQATTRFYEAVPRFDDLIGMGEDLETIAGDLGAPVLSFSPVDQTGRSAAGSSQARLIAIPDLLRTAFSLTEGEYSDRVENDEMIWMVRVDRIIPARQLAFEDVQDELHLAWQRQKQAEILQSNAETIKAGIDAGDTSLSEQAARYGESVRQFPYPIGRDSADETIPQAVRSGVFAASSPGDVLLVPNPDSVDSGEIFILQLTDMDRPDGETLDMLARQVAPLMRERLVDDLFQAYLAGIRDDSLLKVNTTAFTAYKNSLRPQEP